MRGPVEGRTLYFDYQPKQNDSYCCEKLKFHHLNKEQIIFYIQQYREYGIKVNNDVYQKIDFCPWCGCKFSTSLKCQFFEALSNELNKEVGIDDLHQAPAEFKSDEWWKKRNL